ncbi:hypothetical protein C1646_762853 [Rhizophagus diaphanus]|nr:hypothetical protein C1646_762853 [Rhizophagus diaphanus] [Rhizophagus sp. MUCL 43196]
MENQQYQQRNDNLVHNQKRMINSILGRKQRIHLQRYTYSYSCKALRHLVDIVVFPAVVYRDIPSECSGGDLNGNDFTVIYDERVIPLKMHEPMNYQAQKPRMHHQYFHELRARAFPDFMEESDKKSYESQKVLSILYRSINVSEEYAPQTNLNVDHTMNFWMMHES